MAPRGFTNPTPKTDSARSALSSFTCTLCNKSYSRQPEYESHISSYDHQHRKRLQDLKQLSRDPNAAEKARKAEKKADAEAGLRVLNTNQIRTAPGGTTGGGGGGVGFKKGGFKSSFNAVKGPPAAAGPMKKNVLGDDDEYEKETTSGQVPSQSTKAPAAQDDQAESDTGDEYSNDPMGGYYDPRKPTDCFPGCAGVHSPML